MTKALSMTYICVIIRLSLSFLKRHCHNYDITRFYFFGCVTVTSGGDYRLVQAPKGTFFEGNVGSSGENESNWVSMKTQHCS